MLDWCPDDDNQPFTQPSERHQPVFRVIKAPIFNCIDRVTDHQWCVTKIQSALGQRHGALLRIELDPSSFM